MSAIDAIRAERDEVAGILDELERKAEEIRTRIAGLDELAARAIELGLAAAATPRPTRPLATGGTFIASGAGIVAGEPAPKPIDADELREAESAMMAAPEPAPKYRPRRMTIDEAEAAVVEILKADGQVERTAIIDRVDCSRTTIDRALYALLGRGRVHRDAKQGRPTRYTLAPLKALTPVTEAPAQAHECSCDRPQDYLDDGLSVCSKCGKPSAPAPSEAA